jgi:flagellar basal body rod protein FlgF
MMVFPSGWQFRTESVIPSPQWNAFCKQVNQVRCVFVAGKSCQHTNISGTERKQWNLSLGEPQRTDQFLHTCIGINEPGFAALRGL